MQVRKTILRKLHEIFKNSQNFSKIQENDHLTLNDLKKGDKFIHRGFCSCFFTIKTPKNHVPSKKFEK